MLIRLAVAVVLLGSALSAQDVELCEAPVAATETRPALDAQDTTAVEPQLTAIRRTPLGLLAVADEGLETFEFFGLDIGVDQGRRGDADAVDTQIVPIIVDVDGATAGVRGVRLWQSERVVPLMSLDLPLDDETEGLRLVLELEGVTITELGSSHRAGLSRQRWSLVPARMAWITMRGDSELARATFDLDTGSGVVDEARVDEWRIAIPDSGDDTASTDIVALAAEEATSFDGVTTLSLWRRLDEHSTTLLAASHLGAIVPRVALETVGPKRVFTDAVVSSMTIQLDRRGGLYEVVTLTSNTAVWEGVDDGAARISADG